MVTISSFARSQVSPASIAFVWGPNQPTLCEPQQPHSPEAIVYGRLWHRCLSGASSEWSETTGSLRRYHSNARRLSSGLRCVAAHDELSCRTTIDAPFSACGAECRWAKAPRRRMVLKHDESLRLRGLLRSHRRFSECRLARENAPCRGATDSCAQRRGPDPQRL